jgi:hypothetical protein
MKGIRTLVGIQLPTSSELEQNTILHDNNRNLSYQIYQKSVMKSTVLFSV